MTYRELEEAANRLAHLLVGQGVGPGRCVALLLERSVEAIVAMLAVLKTGAAYLPIDPGMPAARIGFMLDDAAPIAAVTSTGLAERLEGHDVAVVEVDDPRIDAQPSTPLPAPGPERSCAPDLHLGYHRGPEGGDRHPPQRGPAVADSLEIGLELAAGTGVVAVSFVCFRLFGVGDLGGAVAGGRLVVVPEAVAGSPEDFHALLVTEHVNVLSQTPSAVAALSPEAGWSRPRW